MDTTREVLKKLIDDHLKDRETPLLFAAWYRMADKDSIYVLEVCEGVSNPGDASWMTFGYLPPEGMEIPGKTLKITYLSPEEFFDAERISESEGRKILDDMRRDGWEVLYVAENSAEAQRIKGTVNEATVGQP